MVTAGLVWCRQCAGYLCHFPRLLRAECDHGFPLGRRSAEGAIPYSRARTLERLFRGEHPDSGRHIGIPRRVPRVVSLSCPAPNGAVVAPRELSVRASTLPLSPGPTEAVVADTHAASAAPVVASPRPASSVPAPLPRSSATAPPDTAVETRLPFGTSSLAVAAQEVVCASSQSPAVPPSLLEVSLLRAESVRGQAATSVEGRPRSLVPSVLLHPSAYSGPDPCLGSRPGPVGAVNSRRGRFRF